jgi:hypothetical protein
MRHSRTAAVVLAALTIAAIALPARAAAPTVDVQPHRLTRGPDIAIPHIEDGDFVDGSRRVELPGTVAHVIGRAVDGWLVGTSNVDRNRNRRVVRVEDDGTVVDVLRNIDPSTVIVSADGTTLAWQRFVRRGRKVITYAASAADGTVLRSKGPNRHDRLLDVAADRVIVGGGKRVVEWTISTGQSRTVVKKMPGMASIAHDRLSFYTRDPYRGGCTLLVKLSKPRVKIWKSCSDRVAGFSPDGTQMMTFHILTDGLGPGEIRLRTIGGTKLATYTSNWFSSWGWESPGIVLLDTNGKKQSAVVRCTRDACENATDAEPVRTP